MMHIWESSVPQSLLKTIPENISLKTRKILEVIPTEIPTVVAGVIPKNNLQSSPIIKVNTIKRRLF